MASHGEDSGQSRWQKIDQLCDRFEAEKRAGKDPQLAEYLQEVSSPEEREQLLRDLIQLDLEVSDELGKTGELQSYLTQLPEHDQLIRTSFDRHQTRASSLIHIHFAGTSTHAGTGVRLLHHRE